MATFLISTAKIKQKGYVNKNVESDLVTTTLRRVQDTMLVPVLGTTFFKGLLDRQETSTLTVEEQALLDDYIAPFLIAAVDYKIVPHLNTKIRSKTVGKVQDEHISPTDGGETLKLQDDLRKDMIVYKNALIGHLKDNEDIFTEYRDYICNFENIDPEKQSQGQNISFI